jgi:hypothetical protein
MIKRTYTKCRRYKNPEKGNTSRFFALIPSKIRIKT